MKPEWKVECDKAYQTTVELLESYRGLGYRYKTAQFRFESCQHPTWGGTSEVDGIITIDPDKHDARAVAHEMGHGFHECLRQDYPQLWKDEEIEGESMAETIRYFVECRMNAHTGDYSQPHLPAGKFASILDACNYNLDSFFQMLSFHRNAEGYRAIMDEYERVTHSPMGIEVECHNAKLRSDRIHTATGCHVVVKFQKGGRITEEHIYRSDAPAVKEVEQVEMVLHLIGPTGGGIDDSLIGKGFVGVLPWELIDFMDPAKRKREDFKFRASTPVRVADVIVDTVGNTTTIILESS